MSRRAKFLVEAASVVRLKPLPHAGTVLKQSARDRLASLGLPEAAIADIAEVVVDAEDHHKAEDDRKEVSTPSRRRAGIRGLNAAIAEVRAAIKQMDLDTRDLVDAFVHKTMINQPDHSLSLTDVLSVIETSIERLRESGEVDGVGRDAMQRSVAARVSRILAKHGIEPDASPKGPANIALQIVLEAANWSTMAKSSRNYLRPKQKRRTGR